MARIRTIKPEFWTDSFMVQLPPLARLIYIALWTAADDHGYVPDESERLAMEVMPKEDALVFDDWVQFFEASGRIELLTDGEGATFYRIVRWADHQRVDKPSRSRIFREGSRKAAIPLDVRRKVAEKYGCGPGDTADAQCFYCGASGQVHWHRLANGRPSGWVTFPGLELDHLEAEEKGGASDAGNIVLACRSCNRSKGSRDWIELLCKASGVVYAGALPSTREPSCEERKGKEGKGRERKESSLRSESSPALPATDILGDREPAPPADLSAHRAERLAQVTADAVETFNASKLVKANGGNLAAVHATVGRDKRKKQVQRCVSTARDICKADYASEVITRDFWVDYWSAVDADDFASGKQRGGKGHENWTPDFEYLTRPATMLKLYDRAASEVAA